MNAEAPTPTCPSQTTAPAISRFRRATDHPPRAQRPLAFDGGTEYEVAVLQNVLTPMREALRLRATVGEVSHALRDVWGACTSPTTPSDLECGPTGHCPSPLECLR